jgi:hypothetical protein
MCQGIEARNTPPVTQQSSFVLRCRTLKLPDMPHLLLSGLLLWRVLAERPVRPSRAFAFHGLVFIFVTLYTAPALS